MQVFPGRAAQVPWGCRRPDPAAGLHTVRGQGHLRRRQEGRDFEAVRGGRGDQRPGEIFSIENLKYF